jgi:hypothetical protein
LSRALLINRDRTVAAVALELSTSTSVGVISLFVAPVYVLQNIYQYLRALVLLRRHEIVPPKYTR